MNFKKMVLKIQQVIFFDDIIKLEDFDLDVLIDKKSHNFFLICNISCKTLIELNPLRIRFNKIDGFIRIYEGATIIDKL